MRVKIKNNRIKMLSTRRIVMKVDRDIYAWAKPYNNPNIINVSTGLSGKFAYSPIFKKCIADTMVILTGYRKKDYMIAEEQTGKKHVPKLTVWHHAWEEKNGEYRMQLVDFNEHKKTCPHAGGCKLWLLNNKKSSKYFAYKEKKIVGNYSDILEFYPIESDKRGYYQRGYVSKRTLSIINRKQAKLIGIDIYGNLLYKTRKNIYFWDHESDEILLLKSS